MDSKKTSPGPVVWQTEDGDTVLSSQAVEQSGLLSRIFSYKFRESASRKVACPFRFQVMDRLRAFLEMEAELNGRAKRYRRPGRVPFQFEIAADLLLEVLLAADYYEVDGLFNLAKKMLLANLESVSSLDGVPSPIVDQLISSASLQQLCQLQDCELLDSELVEAEFARRSFENVFPSGESKGSRALYESNQYHRTGCTLSPQHVTHLLLPKECDLPDEVIPSVRYILSKSVSIDFGSFHNLQRLHILLPSSGRSTPLDLPNLDRLVELQLENCHLVSSSSAASLMTFAVASSRPGVIPNSNALANVSIVDARLCANRLPVTDAWSNLFSLCLAGNSLGLSGFFPSNELLADVRFPRTLHHLSLADNMIYSDDHYWAAFLRRVVDTMRQLRHLDLSRNKLGMEGTLELFRLEHGISHLNLSHNHLGHGFGHNVALHQRRQSNWIHLDLSSNNLPPNEVDEMLIVLKESSRLEMLNVSRQNGWTREYTLLRDSYRNVTSIVFDPIDIETESELLDPHAAEEEEQ